MTKDLREISIKLSTSDLRRIPGDRRQFVRQAVAEKLARETRTDWKPKSAIGRKLLRLRKQFVAKRGKLLDEAGIAEELRGRRGGLS
jgi:hypothetical protein